LPEITGATAVVETFKKLGVKVIFDLPGVHIMPIYDSLYDEVGIRRIMVKHENNASVMADVYGRLTGEPGVALATAGPGATNGVSGVAQAMTASSPMLHLSGTVPTNALPSILHGVETPDFLKNVFAPVTKWSSRVKNFEGVARSIARGYELARKPRKGPVHIEVPFDVLREKGEAQQDFPIPSGWRRKSVITPEVTQLIDSSKNPIVYAGKSVSRERALDEVVALAEALNAPVIINRFYPDVFPISHRLFAGYITSDHQWILDPVAEMLFGTADLILALGVQWGSAETDLLMKFSSKPCIHIDVDRGFPVRRHRPTFRVTGDVKAIISEITQRASPRKGQVQGGGLAGEVTRASSANIKIIRSIIEEKRQTKPIYPGLLASELAKAADKDALVLLDGGSNSTWILDVYAREKPATFLWPGGYDSIGFSFPASIAAKVAYPDRQVICVIGDGGFLMSYMDMPTALENNLPITVVVANNHTYGDIWLLQRRSYNARYIGTDLHSANYAELARSFGAQGIRVEEPSALGAACKEALSSGKFTLLDVVTDVKYPFLREELAARSTNATGTA